MTGAETGPWPDVPAVLLLEPTNRIPGIIDDVAGADGGVLARVISGLSHHNDFFTGDGAATSPALS